jgi:GrpB-like predicted nucleotidyltransferase (UPF0157 family)
MIPDRVRALAREHVAIVDYDPRWPEVFAREKAHLLAALPADLVRRVEHFGSTAVPGLAAKPIVDMLVEVTDLDETRRRIVPILESQGYEYIWRPTRGNDEPPFYAWFIKRDAGSGVRTHHIHMVEPQFPQWQALLFRDYLQAHPDIASEYIALKRRLAGEHPTDRIAYTEGKSEFVARVTEAAARIVDRRPPPPRP